LRRARATAARLRGLARRIWSPSALWLAGVSLDVAKPRGLGGDLVDPAAAPGLEGAS